jgi:RNA polymerase sigma-70 factor (ECF subfamily)
LIGRAQHGDATALAELLEQLRPRMVKMAHFYARRCGEDADDLLQEAWLEILEELPNANLTIGAPEQFLLQRARWRVLDCIKAARLRRCASLELEESIDEAVCAGLNCTVPETTLVFWLADFCMRLNPTQQLIVAGLLRGLTWREIGQAMGCSSANIAYHMRHIRRHYECWERE